MSRCALSKWMSAAGVVVAVSFPTGARAADGVEQAAAERPVVAARPAPQGEAVTLKYRFEPNQEAHYKVVHKMSTSSQMGRAIQTTLSEWTTYKHLRVVSVAPDGAATLETTIDRIQAFVQLDKDKPEKYDSEKDDEPPAPLRNVCRSIGKPLAMTQFTTSGELIKADLIKSEDDHSSHEAADEGKDDPKSKSFLISMPPSPVRVGDTWKDPFSVNVSVPPNLTTPVTLNRTYTLASIENGVATIRLETSILTPVNNPKVMAQLMQRTPQGTILFDVKKGLIIGRTLTIDETVHEFAGAGTKARAESSLIETLVDPKEVAVRPAAKVVPASAP